MTTMEHTHTHSASFCYSQHYNQLYLVAQRFLRHPEFGGWYYYVVPYIMAYIPLWYKDTCAYECLNLFDRMHLFADIS